MQISAIQKTSMIDFPGKVACIVFTPGCNFRCPFCHNPDTVLPERIAELQDSFIPEEVFFNFLEQKKHLLDGVSICGGEPTLQADLYDFIVKIKAMGLAVKLDTNGQNADIVEQLINEGLLDYLAIDIKNPVDKYENLVWVPCGERFFDNYNRCLKKALESGVTHEYRTTVIKGHHTLEDIEAMAKYIKGVQAYYLQNFRPDLTLDPNFQGESFSEEELASMQDIATPYVQCCGIRK